MQTQAFIALSSVDIGSLQVLKAYPMLYFQNRIASVEEL